MTLDRNTVLGQGLVTPLRRRGGDFVSGVGLDDIRSNLQQLLTTRRGELRWRPDFGMNLDPYRHRNIDELMLAEISAEVRNNIMRYETRVEIQDLEVRQLELGSEKVVVRIVWAPVSRSARGTVLLADNQTTEIPL